VNTAYTLEFGNSEYVFYHSSAPLEKAGIISDEVVDIIDREVKPEFSNFSPYDVMQGADKLRWTEAMRKELDSLIDKGSVVASRPNRDDIVLSCRWVLRDKAPKADGSLGQPKARIAIHGYGAREGVDYRETFAPTSQMSTLRYFLMLFAKVGYEAT
jgi:hypothetical protein